MTSATALKFPVAPGSLELSKSVPSEFSKLHFLNKNNFDYPSIMTKEGKNTKRFNDELYRGLIAKYHEAELMTYRLMEIDSFYHLCFHYSSTC